MKKYSAYKIYQVFALCLVALCWGWVGLVSPARYQAQLSVMNATMENDLVVIKNDIKIMDSSNVRRVTKDGSPRYGLESLKRIKVLRKRAQAVLDKIEQMKQAIKANNAVHEVMIRQANIDTLNRFTQAYAHWLNKEFKYLDVPKFVFSTKFNGVSLRQHFSHSTPIAAIAWLSRKQLDVRRFENEVTRKSLYYGSTNVCFMWWFMPSVVPHTVQIEVGDEYTADLFMGISASRVRPRMTSYKQPIPMMEGKSEVKIPTQKHGTFYWTGTVAYQHLYTKKDTTITFHRAYQVLPQTKQ